MPVGLSASTIGRLKEAWQDEHAQRQKRDLSAKRYVYVWADGIYLEARLEDEKQCIRVLIGATSEGKKELVGFTVTAPTLFSPKSNGPNVDNQRQGGSLGLKR